MVVVELVNVIILILLVISVLFIFLLLWIIDSMLLGKILLSVFMNMLVIRGVIFEGFSIIVFFVISVGSSKLFVIVKG